MSTPRSLDAHSLEILGKAGQLVRHKSPCH